MLEDHHVQALFFEILGIALTLIGGFAMIYRTWIKPLNERLAEYDRKFVKIQENIRENQESIKSHEAECQTRMERIYNRFDGLTESINALSVQVAKINK